MDMMKLSFQGLFNSYGRSLQWQQFARRSTEAKCVYVWRMSSDINSLSWGIKDSPVNKLDYFPVPVPGSPCAFCP